MFGVIVVGALGEFRRKCHLKEQVLHLQNNLQKCVLQLVLIYDTLPDF
jgi:hypothetical protein